MRFGLSRGWISKDHPVIPPADLVVKARDEVVGLKTLKDIYQNLYPETANEAIARRIKRGIRNKEWEIFL